MTMPEKVAELRARIETILSPLVDRPYWLLEVPYYSNIGDTLIWQGERDFLAGLSPECRGMHALESFSFPKLNTNDLILFQGGGNFGDLWPRHHDFKMKVIETYPENEFLFFPQTVYFENKENRDWCAKFLADKKVTICARDDASYRVLKENFSNRILLVPDLAFCMRISPWYKPIKGTGTFLLKREDKELRESPLLKKIEQRNDVTVSDWVTFRGATFCERIFNRVKGLSRRDPFQRMGLGKMGLGKRLIDFYGEKVYRPFLVRSGIKQLGAYETIYTTRLHAAILGILLEKKVFFLDNSYGKNRAFYETWLRDCENLQFVEM